MRRLEGRTPIPLCCVALLAVLAPERWPRVTIEDPFTEAAVQYALDGVSRWLEDARCQALFSDFRDPNGRPLDERLRELGQDGRGYLALVLFRDGTGSDRCEQGEALAFTRAGGRVVFVCRRFERVWKAAPRRAQAALLHETLHTLGLGENPPPSQAITQRVLHQCDR
jgi:hypothetical protein